MMHAEKKQDNMRQEARRGETFWSTNRSGSFGGGEGGRKGREVGRERRDGVERNSNNMGDIVLASTAFVSKNDANGGNVCAKDTINTFTEGIFRCGSGYHVCINKCNFADFVLQH